MNPRKHIEVSFAQVSAQADALTDCTEELRRLQSRLDGVMQELNAGWQGMSATRYLEKCEGMRNKLERSADHLDRIADVIRSSAEGYYQAEMRALERVHTKDL